MSGVTTGRRLQVCRENMLSRRPEIRAALVQAGWRVETEDCLDKCTRCGHCAFALVNGTYKFASTPEAFLKGLTGSPKGRNGRTPRGKRTGRGGSPHATQ